MGSIYKITNTVNGKAYIGQTIHDAVKGRIDKHLNGKPNGSRLVRRAVKKYGKDAFAYEILHDGIIPEFLDTLEIEAINQFNTIAPHGYNLETGGSNGSPSEVTRRKISESLSGRKTSEETRRKLAEAQKGKTLSPETRRKLIEANKGRKHTPETRLKMSENQKGKNNVFYGKKHSSETRRKWSKARKGKPLSEKTKRKMSKARFSPHKKPAKHFFSSLPENMPLTEKRKNLHAKFGDKVHRSTICIWVRQWSDTP